MKTIYFKIRWWIYVISNLFFDVPEVNPDDPLYYDRYSDAKCDYVYFSFSDGIWMIKLKDKDYSISWGVEKFYRYDVYKKSVPEEKEARKIISIMLLLLLIIMLCSMMIA